MVTLAVSEKIAEKIYLEYSSFYFNRFPLYHMAGSVWLHCEDRSVLALHARQNPPWILNINDLQVTEVQSKVDSDALHRGENGNFHAVVMEMLMFVITLQHCETLLCKKSVFPQQSLNETSVWHF